MAVRILNILWIAVCLAGHIFPGAPPQPRDGTEPVVQILEPNGGNVFPSGTTAKISWRSASIPPGDKMALILYDQGVKALTISSGCPNSGNFDWKIPQSIKPGNRYRVRIRWTRNPAVNDFSDKDFSIISDSP